MFPGNRFTHHSSLYQPRHLGFNGETQFSKSLVLKQLEIVSANTQRKWNIWGRQSVCQDIFYLSAARTASWLHPVSLTFDPCRSGALQPRTRVREGPVPPAPPPQRQPGSALWPQQPAEPGPLSLHSQPPGGLFHPAAAGTCSCSDTSAAAVGSLNRFARRRVVHLSPNFPRKGPTTEVNESDVRYLFTCFF